MEKNYEMALAGAVKDFRLPRYEEIPNIGLYLEQTTKYINQCLEPLGCIQVTSSMIRNYVKMKMVDNPVKKQYCADHIAHLIAITVLKTVMSLDQIKIMFEMQEKRYEVKVAYDYLAEVIENILRYRFGLEGSLEDSGEESSMIKTMLYSAIMSVSHIIYLNACFDIMDEQDK